MQASLTPVLPVKNLKNSRTPDQGTRCSDVLRRAPSCADNSRTAVSSWESFPVRLSPIGRVSGMSTGRGFSSIVLPSSVVIRTCRHPHRRSVNQRRGCRYR